MPFDSAPEIKTDVAADIADAAANLLERKGWCQHRSRNEKGQLCLVGALNEVTVLNMRRFKEIVSRMSLDRHEICGKQSAIGWNDTQGRSAAEVIARLRFVRNNPPKYTTKKGRI